MTATSLSTTTRDEHGARQNEHASSCPGPDTGSAAGIQLTDISLSYRQGSQAVHVLDRIGLSLAPDEFVCLLGPSGCGKSTLLSIIAGYVQPSGGSVRIDGKHHTKPTPQVGVVFQHANLFPGCRSPAMSSSACAWPVLDARSAGASPRSTSGWWGLRLLPLAYPISCQAG